MLLWREAPALWLGKRDSILSLRGVQQGDPLGPALFALAFHPVLRKVRGYHPGVRVLAGHDDFYILGPPADCLAGYATFIAHAAGVGLSVDVCRSRVYSMGMDTLADASAAITAA